jgi:hypothetical protein
VEQTVGSTNRHRCRRDFERRARNQNEISTRPTDTRPKRAELD